MSKPYCCYVNARGRDCPSRPNWLIWYGPSPYDCTDACTRHVGSLLSDGEHRVFPIEMFQEKA